MPSSAVTTNTTADRRTTAVYCSSIGESGVSGMSGWVAVRAGAGGRGKGSTPSCGSIRSCYLGSRTPGRARGVRLDEPAAGNLHGGVCEGGEPGRATVDLNGNEAGNGGYSQRKPTAHLASSTRRISLQTVFLNPINVEKCDEAKKTVLSGATDVRADR